MKPSYLDLSKSAWKIKIEEAYSLLEGCRVCPRACGINRLEDQRNGICRSGLRPVVASHNIHMGEEPSISGARGSGTIFFTSCNMRCVFCQNYPISQLSNGNEVEVEELARMMCSLKERGCHNINLVTPSHFVPQIIKAVSLAKEDGLDIPIIYNTSGYDSLDSLKLLEGIVDIYLPDMRYADKDYSLRYSGVANYPAVNRAAVKEMYRQAGDLITEDGIAIRGLVVRHLILPNNISGTDEVMHFISSELSKEVYISLMDQYFPAYKAHELPELSGRITKEDYDKAFRMMIGYGLENGWVQEHIEA
ncbi:MAG: radical SAM protein [Nitrospirota bacterium]